ncbi:hypothetical protein OC846_006350 [Tilletia horrida]|uniref:JmjC domain-containing protein n=1 Tax=Tilletia horrida TaxID=155126 RepID=A0AAN6GLT3_9BASI|nr:hypothetical protein OC846_006350 [Tilletia horrida]
MVASGKKKNKNIELPRAWLPPPSAPIPPGQPFLIQPDEYYPTTYSDSVHWNAVPVFRPTWEQFQDFFTYCQRIRPHGMQTGIVKIVPPQEWLDIQPDLTQRLEHIKIRRPLRQVVQPGGEGIYQQTNQPQRDCIFTVREWADMCASAEHRGPELKKIQDRLAERYELLALQKTRSRRRSNRAQDEQGDDHPQEGEVSTSQLAEQQGSTSAPSQLLEISAESTPLPTPPPSIAIEPAFPRIENDSLDATAETTTTEAPRHLTSAVHEPPSLLAQAEEETKPDLASVLSELDPPTAAAAAAAAAAAIHSTATSESPITVKPDPEDEKKSGADPKWNYKTAWMYEYLPPKFAAQATDADWTIDVCSEIEIEYWRSLGSLRSGGGSVYGRSAAALKAAWYGADQSGTLFDDDMRVWNVGKLDNVLTRMLGCIDEDGHWRNLNLDPIAGEGEESKDTKSGKVKIDRKGKGKATEDDRPTASSSLDSTSASAIAGVTTPYLYFGQWQATFSWHIEDMDLYSINYIHFGAPKQWYAIPQSERNRFETVMQTFFPTDAHRCKQFLRHKSYLVNPARLASIKPLKLVQHAGEIVLTFPFGYHSGFNLGFNCAESTNFALDDWPQLGMEAQVCQCLDREKPVHINVRKLYREAMAAQEKEDGGEADDEGGARRELAY